jgi:hypothetical protein
MGMRMTKGHIEDPEWTEAEAFVERLIARCKLKVSTEYNGTKDDMTRQVMGLIERVRKAEGRRIMAGVTKLMKGDMT